MSYLFATETFNLEDIEEFTTEYPELSGDEEIFYFEIVEEEDTEETSDSNSTSIDNEEIVYSTDNEEIVYSTDNEEIVYSTDNEEIVYSTDNEEIVYSTDNEEIVYSTDITSLHQINIVDTIKSFCDDGGSDIESQSEEIMDSEEQNSNIPPENLNECTENIDSVIQNNIYDISSDSDENTGQSEISSIVNLKAVRFIKNRKRTFPTYYQKEIFTRLIHFLSNKMVNDILNIRIQANGYRLHVKDLMTLLTPKTWLNDSVIQNYLSLLVNYCDKTKEMSTDFLTSYQQVGYDLVIRWFKKYDLNNFNRIVVPINPGKVHWALFVIEIWEGKIYYFDSYSEPSFMEELTSITEFLSRAIIDYINFSGVQRTAPKYWKYIDGKSPLQSNTYDCGVFTCMNARYFLLNKQPSVKFTQENIPILRQIISWELLTSSLETF